MCLVKRIETLFLCFFLTYMKVDKLKFVNMINACLSYKVIIYTTVI